MYEIIIITLIVSFVFFILGLFFSSSLDNMLNDARKGKIVVYTKEKRKKNRGGYYDTPQWVTRDA